MKILILFLSVLIANQACSQNNIANARKKSIGNTVTVSGIVTNGSELGQIRYLQDNSAGIAVYDAKLSSVKRGDSITVTGELDDYNNLLEIKNVSNITTHSEGNSLPAPKLLTIDQIGEEYEGQLIKIDAITIDESNSVFAGGTNYSFSNESKIGTLRINLSSPIVGKPIPTNEIGLIAICSQYSRQSNDTRDGYQLLPRDMEDFKSDAAVQITSPVSVVEISNSSISLTWETNTGALPFVRYGSSMNKNSLINIVQGTSTTGEKNRHVVDITGLQASELVYAQAFSAIGTDTAFSTIGTYITESNSSGKINIYFNTSVDKTQASDNIAMNVGNAMEDTLAAYINRAKESIDFCIYNFNNQTIENALNSAYDRGVKIRLITCECTSHHSTNSLRSGIPVLERPDIQQGGIMHNKFAIFDGNSTDFNKVWIWTGSTNLTETQLTADANHMIFIQDKSLARTYELEFEEMWGSTEDKPNSSRAKFGNEKTNNTPHEHLIGGKRVQCYFSPSDNTNQQLINAINTADNDLNIQTMLITRSDLAYAIANAHKRNVRVHVLTNYKADNSETVNTVLKNELPEGKYIFDNIGTNTLHHKLAIVDANDINSDPQVITGSHNWSNSANTRNDENTLIIHSADIANQYFQQFAYRFKENKGKLIVSAQTVSMPNIKIYPNPTANTIHVSSTDKVSKIELYSINGNLIKQIIPDVNTMTLIDLSTLRNGIYLLKVESNNKVSSYKIIKQ